jgi:hypothetical protein
MKSFPAIYDFTVLPYALGDVLTWNVKMMIKAKENNLEKIKIHILLDENCPQFVHQRRYINGSNCWEFFNDLFPAFQTNPMFDSLEILTSREKLLGKIKSLKKESQSEGVIAYLEEHEFIVENCDNILTINSYFKKYISTHSDLNKFQEDHNYLPTLESKESFKSAVQKTKDQIGNYIFIAVNFRLRAFDETSDPAMLDRDSKLDVWLDFFGQSEATHPKVKFVLLGRIQEKPIQLLNLTNVFLPRAIGQTLGHELAWLETSLAFMGSSSGFAAMANFIHTPYIITRMNPNAYNNYQIPEGSDRLPFAVENQVLVEGIETVNVLENYLSNVLKGVNTNDFSVKNSDIELNKYQESMYQKLKDSNQNLTVTLDTIKELIESKKFYEAEKKLNAKLFKTLTSDEQVGYFHYYLSCIQYYKNEFVEAKASVVRSISRIKTDDPDIVKLRKKINSQLLLDNLNRFEMRNLDIEDDFQGIELMKSKIYNEIDLHEEANHSYQIHKNLNTDKP